MRYLTEYFIRTAFHRGKSVGQFLGGALDGDEPTIRWLDLGRESEQFVLTFYEKFDEGSDSFFDIVEFSDAEVDADPPEHTFDTLDEAMAFSESAYGASPLRWVNESVLEEEYRAYRRDRLRGAL